LGADQKFAHRAPPVCDDGSVPVEIAAPRPRRSQEELRTLLIDAGRSILEEEGLGIGAGDLSFKRVFADVEASTGSRITNASVIRRVWDNLDDYRTDLMVAVAAQADSAGELDRTLEALSPLLASADRSTPEARMWTLCEMARIGGGEAIRARLETREWSLWIGVWVLSVTTAVTGRQSDVRDALTNGLEGLASLWDEVFTGVCALLGIRVREPLTLRHFTVAVSAMVEGSALREGGQANLEVIVRPTGPQGEPQEWTLFGVCMEALALRFFEIDPEWVGP